jgi:predicted carbohydrate-binding protein with CBM5 and CBM33 domain
LQVFLLSASLSAFPQATGHASVDRGAPDGPAATTEELSMRRTVAYPLAAAGAVLTTLVTALPALAHGYVSQPPSRQALCAARSVPDCGPIQFEPQSVEGPKGLTTCSANLPQFAVLDDESRDWPATTVGTSVDFSWVLTARHATSTWQYFIGDRKIAEFDDGGRQPNATVTHTVDLSGFSGRQKILAVWNIADTPNAFYNCIDVNVGGTGGGGTGGGDGGGGSQPTATQTSQPTATQTSAPAPTATRTATSTATSTGSTSTARGTWRTFRDYRTGDVVSFEGVRYTCRQSHTSLPGWEPSIFTLALWLPQS